MVLFFMEVSTPKVQIAGVTAMPNGQWMSQIGRNLTDGIDGFLSGKRYLIHDRDPLFTAEFLQMLADVGVKSVKLPPRSLKRYPVNSSGLHPWWPFQLVPLTIRW